MLRLRGGDRGDLTGWVALMNELGVTPPTSVQRLLDGGRVGGGRRRRDVVPGAPTVGPAPVSEAGYDARLQSMGGGTAPQGAMPYADYSRAAAFARLGDPAKRPDLARRFTVPTQVGGVPNVIPRGARITYPGAAEAAEGFTPPPAQQTPQFGRPPRRRR